MTVTFSEWKYCPRCKSEAVVEVRPTDNPHFKCEQCGVEAFDSPWVGTIALIENMKGELLLIQRAVPPQVGTWDLPGGFLNEGETLDACVLREVEEETGIKLHDIVYKGNEASNYGGHPSLSVIFKGITDEEPTLSEENLSYKWWRAEEEVPSLAFIDVKKALLLWQAERLNRK